MFIDYIIILQTLLSNAIIICIMIVEQLILLHSQDLPLSLVVLCLSVQKKKNNKSIQYIHRIRTYCLTGVQMEQHSLP